MLESSVKRTGQLVQGGLLQIIGTAAVESTIGACLDLTEMYELPGIFKFLVKMFPTRSGDQGTATASLDLCG